MFIQWDLNYQTTTEFGEKQQVIQPVIFSEENGEKHQHVRSGW